MITVELHDDKHEDAVKGRMKGPTHAGTAFLSFDYQVEELVKEVEADHTFIVRIVTDTGREWKRIEGKFVEVSPRA